MKDEKWRAELITQGGSLSAEWNADAIWAADSIGDFSIESANKIASPSMKRILRLICGCLLYTSDAADEMD